MNTVCLAARDTPFVARGNAMRPRIEETYRVFTHSWWWYKNTLICGCTYEEARRVTAQYNVLHPPGRFRRKAGFVVEKTPRP